MGWTCTAFRSTMSAPNCCVALVSLSIILFICNVVRGTTNDNGGTAGAAHYLQCSDQSSIHFSKVLVITFNLTKLFRPAPVTCASNCLAINRTYVYAFIHIPATNQFRNQLVCGCGFKQAIDPASALSDDFCNLACPQVPSVLYLYLNLYRKHTLDVNMLINNIWIQVHDCLYY